MTRQRKRPSVRGSVSIGFTLSLLAPAAAAQGDAGLLATERDE